MRQSISMAVNDECKFLNYKLHKSGYIYLTRNNRSILAHRYFYEKEVGKIPANKFIDHLCRNRACVNVDHMDIVTNRENILRGIGPTAINAKKTQCKRGHNLFGKNLYRYPDGRRGCRECHRILGCVWARNYRRRKQYVSI